MSPLFCRGCSVTRRDADRDDDHDALSGLLDPEWPGVRGASPASRQELAELILRYRDEQSSRRARRLEPDTKKPRFRAGQGDDGATEQGTGAREETAG